MLGILAAQTQQLLAIIIFSSVHENQESWVQTSVSKILSNDLQTRSFHCPCSRASNLVTWIFLPNVLYDNYYTSKVMNKFLSQKRMVTCFHLCIEKKLIMYNCIIMQERLSLIRHLSSGILDYVPITTSLSFTSIPQTNCIQFNIVDSTSAEPTEFFIIAAGPVTAIITIIDGSGKIRKERSSGNQKCFGPV